MSSKWMLNQETGGKYNMIIGSDIIEELGINILYSDHCIIRDSVRLCSSQVTRATSRRKVLQTVV